MQTLSYPQNQNQNQTKTKTKTAMDKLFEEECEYYAGWAGHSTLFSWLCRDWLEEKAISDKKNYDENKDIWAQEAELNALAFRQKAAAEIVAVQVRRNLGKRDIVQKRCEPCKMLYSCEGDKSTGGARPTTLHVSSECWSHERINPKTGLLEAPHKCDRLHPGEEGWFDAWSTDRRIKSPAQIKERALATAYAPAQQQSRFSTLGGGQRQQKRQ